MYSLDRFSLLNDGLYFLPPDKFVKPKKGEEGDGEWQEQEPIWLCSPIEVSALTTDMDASWGKLLRIENYDGAFVEWVMPSRLLAKKEELWQSLLDRGLRLASTTRHRDLLHHWLNTKAPTGRALVVTRLGWHENDEVTMFVRPDEVIGGSTTRIIYQSAAASNSLKIRGTVDEWIERIGKLCVGNTRMVLGTSMSFAAPLVYLMGEESFGVQFRGSSRDGKSTAQYVANSTGGSKKGVRSWRATANSLEAIAEEHCDGLLCLDELSLLDDRAAGDAAYTLANGLGKSRLRPDASLRPVREWQLAFLSTGEHTLTEKLLAAGKKVSAGQTIRLLDVESPDSGMGIFENIHGWPTPKAFADHLRNTIMEVYGAPLRAFLEQIAELFRSDEVELRSFLRHQRDRFVIENLPAGASGQVGSACARFGMIATAGELASVMKLTGWPEGEATRAGVACFKAWLDKRGSAGDGDIEAAIRQVRAYIERDAVRFEDLTIEGAPIPYGRVGFINRNREYCVLPEMWAVEVCKGYPAADVAKEMCKRGLMIGQGGKTSGTIKLPGHKSSTRVYRISPHILTPGDPDTRTEAQRRNDMVAHMMTDDDPPLIGRSVNGACANDDDDVSTQDTPPGTPGTRAHLFN
jgi:putative DNA primase/helicase